MRTKLMIFVVLALAACTGPGPRGAMNPTMAEPPETKVIPFFTTETDEAQIAVLQSLIDEYRQAHPEVEVSVTLASPTARERRLLTMLASGSVVGCSFEKNDSPPPWGGPIFSAGGVIDLMLQDIYFGEDIESAWAAAVEEMEAIQAQWEADNA